MEEKNQLTDTITFLGTGGARFMIITQLLASGGFWLNLGGTELLVDPGPGCIVQATKRKLNPQHLSAIILSHRHLDHSGDTNIMVEAMTNGGHNQHGKFFAPADALDFEPVIYSYLRNYLESIEILQEGKSYSVDDISFSTPVRHIHRVDTYGIVFKTPRHTFSYITDTRYFDGLLKHYASELLIINLVFLEHHYPSDNPLTPADHLSVPDAEYLIRELKPKAAILTHFGMSVWRAQPWKIAEQLTQRTGVKVIAARDGMTLDLGTMESAKD
ncbi:MAG: MBL fold hydrolase [Chloroflexi bacterium RBG_16_51_9]|nr:MAG: MBL fold hydrolase [Chloroflexi bacterium RBG_16_51_9]